MNTGILYLIPNFIGPGHKEDIPLNQRTIIYSLNTFIVESEKSARLFLKTIEHPLAQSEFEFHVLNEHSAAKEDLTPFFKQCLKGSSLGLLSDAGIPCVADPGNRAVSFAHRNKIQVVPMSGPSSIYMALMASGFNGQHFEFHGYLPVDTQMRLKKIKAMEQETISFGKSQLFMETPYRNKALLDFLIKHLKPKTKLCIAANLDTELACIVSKEMGQWTNTDIELNKQPAIFILGT